MDPPDHLQYRHVSAAWFKPRSIARLEDRATELATRFVDHMAGLGGECDFVTEVAIHYPLYMILSLLGLPEEDFPRMLKLTQEMFGSSDPELRRDTGGDELMATLLEFFEYFQGLIEDRRARPRDDLSSMIANARIDGEDIGTLEVIGYYVIIATAGHDTTSSAIAGGMHALLEHPDRFRGRRVGLVLSGGNVDTRLLASVIMRSLARRGCLTRLAVEISDVPGALARVTGVVGRVGANIVEVSHRRDVPTVELKEARLELVVETRDRDHLDELCAALRAEGYAVSLEPVGVPGQTSSS